MYDNCNTLSKVPSLLFLTEITELAFLHTSMWAFNFKRSSKETLRNLNSNCFSYNHCSSMSTIPFVLDRYTLVTKTNINSNCQQDWKFPPSYWIRSPISTMLISKRESRIFICLYIGLITMQAYWQYSYYSLNKRAPNNLFK